MEYWRIVERRQLYTTYLESTYLDREIGIYKSIGDVITALTDTGLNPGNCTVTHYFQDADGTSGMRIVPARKWLKKHDL
jgi:hypothetical protein